MEKVAFGGGCFWCTEAVFKKLKGITKVVPGYTGGEMPHPTYLQVCSGNTGHAEVIYLEYDPKQIAFKDLLTVFFGSHDPTTINRQGNDVGTHYRSAIFYASESQKSESENMIARINASNPNGAPVVTELKPLEKFYEAENYHHDYFSRNPEQDYCKLIINPKLEKVQKEFAELLKATA